MTRSDDAIGSIKCPLCDRAAEVHKFAERQKVSADAEGGRRSYPAKVFIVCPPTSGYRGCGTILANSLEAQGRIMERARINGAPRTHHPAQPVPKDKPAVEPSSPPPAKPAQPAAAPARNPFNPFSR